MGASLSLRSERAESSRLVAFVEGFARRHHLSAPERARLSIILDELFANAVEHGYRGGDPSGRVEVALAFDGSRLTIEFIDHARPFEPLTGTPPDLDRPAAERQIGGLGLHIVRSLVDDARYSREGDRNRLVLTRKIVGVGRNDAES